MENQSNCGTSRPLTEKLAKSRASGYDWSNKFILGGNRVPDSFHPIHSASNSRITRVFERNDVKHTILESHTLLLEGENYMNRSMQEKWSWIEATHSLRSQLLESLSNADLAFSPGGENVTLGRLLRESGEVEYSYIHSLKTFKQDWSSHHTDAGLESDLPQIKAWYATLDEEMEATLAAFSEEDLSKTIDRGGGSSMPVDMQLDAYLQAQLIFLGKAGVYFRAMNRALPQLFQEYIG